MLVRFRTNEVMCISLEQVETVINTFYINEPNINLQKFLDELQIEGVCVNNIIKLYNKLYFKHTI